MISLVSWASFERSAASEVFAEILMSESVLPVDEFVSCTLLRLFDLKLVKISLLKKKKKEKEKEIRYFF